jgi:hypothetical protein
LERAKSNSGIDNMKSTAAVPSKYFVTVVVSTGLSLITNPSAVVEVGKTLRFWFRRKKPGVATNSEISSKSDAMAAYRRTPRRDCVAGKSWFELA